VLSYVQACQVSITELRIDQFTDGKTSVEKRSYMNYHVEVASEGDCGNLTALAYYYKGNPAGDKISLISFGPAALVDAQKSGGTDLQ
jgi:hypothetical protein